jgi:K+-sensing histidine kinase KdpD
MMKRVFGRDLHEFEQFRALLAALSDDLALPLLQIKTNLEILDGKVLTSKSSQEHTKSMSLSADAGLQLVEAYRLALRAKTLNHHDMEPVAVGAVLQEVAHQLTPYANQYATDLEVDIQGKLTPVLAHRPSLTTALQCLAASMIRAQAATSQQRRYRLLLGAHRSSGNIAAGVFSDVHGLSDKTLRTAHELVGKAHQPMSGVPTGAASGVLIADMLCGSLWQPLRAAAHRKMGGLATSVPISKQLQFI